MTKTQNIRVSEAGRGWSSGSADIDGCPVSWEAYRKNESSIRVMLSQAGRWVKPGSMGAARLAIEPAARGAMQ